MSDTTPKYIFVENHIKAAIKKKELVDKLPGERTLAAQLGVSYMTVRKSVENLVSQGVLYKVPTKGTYVNYDKPQRRKNFTIGYFLDATMIAGISSPYYSLIFDAIEKVAAKDDYSVVYFSDNNPDRLKRTLSKVDGVIATCIPRIEHVILEMKQSVPVVVIENSAADKVIPSVIIDNFNADVESVDYACSLGHSNIGFMTGLDDSDVGKNRYAGYQYGLRKNKIELDKSLVFNGNYSYQSGIEGAEYFLTLDELPTTVICANDSMALGAIRHFRQEGLNIPEDISIIGFDNIDVAAQIVPSLTTIASPIDEIAKHSFSILKALIDGKTIEQQHIALPAHLIIRDSCATAKDKSAAA
jgi:DNA-binding LacI/PurR family transcriptional regulator